MSPRRQDLAMWLLGGLVLLTAPVALVAAAPFGPYQGCANAEHLEPIEPSAVDGDEVDLWPWPTLRCSDKAESGVRASTGLRMNPLVLLPLVPLAAGLAVAVAPRDSPIRGQARSSSEPGGRR